MSGWPIPGREGPHQAWVSVLGPKGAMPVLRIRLQAYAYSVTEGPITCLEDPCQFCESRFVRGCEDPGNDASSLAEPPVRIGGFELYDMVLDLLKYLSDCP